MSYHEDKLSEDPIRDYLRVLVQAREIADCKMSEGTHSIDEFVLQHGLDWEPQALPADIPRMTRKLCFNNAYLLAIERGAMLTYVEGYAVRDILPVLHAWCVDSDGCVVDPTWDDPEHCQYVGIPFELPFVTKIVLDGGYPGVIDRMDLHWPLLHEPLYNETDQWFSQRFKMKEKKTDG